MVSIRGCGSYVPLYRIERATIAAQHGDPAADGETAVPAHDEGVVSLAVAAAKNALAHADDPPEALDAIYAASTSDPFDERGIAPHVAVALGAGEDLRVADFGGSARAATDAFLSGRDAIEAGRADRVLVVGTDVLRADAGTAAERTGGSGAAAMVLGSTGGFADLTDAASHASGFVGRFRRAGESPVEGDARFNRERYLEAVDGAVAGLDVSDPDHAVLPAPDVGWGERALGSLDLDATLRTTFDEVGYAGAAGVLLDAVLALETAATDDEILVVSYGPGGAGALVLDRGESGREPDTTTETYLASKEYVTYAKHREYRGTGGEA